ncbi:Transcription initiation factor TFIID subunit 13, partial [Blyttiomyces sp. JEL0837]
MSSRRERSKKRIFSKEIKQLMYGYGDVPNPADDSAEVMEDLLMLYLRDLATKMVKVSTGKRIKVSDLLHVLRKEPKKLIRVHELLSAERELSKAKAIINMDELPLSNKTETANASNALSVGGLGGNEDDEGDRGLSLPGGSSSGYGGGQASGEKGSSMNIFKKDKNTPSMATTPPPVAQSAKAEQTISPARTETMQHAIDKGTTVTQESDMRSSNTVGYEVPQVSQRIMKELEDTEQEFAESKELLATYQNALTRQTKLTEKHEHEVHRLKEEIRKLRAMMEQRRAEESDEVQRLAHKQEIELQHRFEVSEREKADELGQAKQSLASSQRQMAETQQEMQMLRMQKAAMQQEKEGYEKKMAEMNQESMVKDHQLAKLKEDFGKVRDETCIHGKERSELKMANDRLAKDLDLH